MQQTKLTILIVIMAACAFGLTGAYFFMPKQAPCNNPMFTATKQFKLKFDQNKPFCIPYYLIEVTYAGDGPAYVQLVGNRPEFVIQQADTLPMPFNPGSFLMIPGDVYRSTLDDNSQSLEFIYVPLEARPGHQGSVSYRLTGPQQMAALAP